MRSVATMFLFIMLGLVACRKERTPEAGSSLHFVRTALKDSMDGEAYRELDFTRAVLSRVDSMQLYFLRVPFRGEKLSQHFVLVQITGEGRYIRGRQVRVSRWEEGGRRAFNGVISIQELNGRPPEVFTVVDGYMKRQRANPFITGTASLQPDPYKVLPEVIVVATRNADEGLSYSDWISLQSLFGDEGSGGSAYYGSMDGASAGSSGTYYGGGGNVDPYGSGGEGMASQEHMILVDIERQDQLPAIDIEKYMRCFSTIPDEGSVCSIEIFADIPVDTDPNKIFDFNSGSPGHTFIQIKKANGDKSAIQNIGFYPKLGWKPIATNAPIDGKLVDNGEHEFNASLKMMLSPQNFNSTLNEILYLAKFIKYDIDNYNCTDFALDVFNKTRREKLDIPLIHIPGNYPSVGTRTPQGLYLKLRQLKDSGHPETQNITIGIKKGWVAKSTGPCN